MKKDTLVFIGSSGSGKGTQIRLLKEYIKEHYPDTNIIHYDSGAHFRSFVERDGYTSQQMRNILGRGELAPDFITSWLLVSELVTKLTPEKMLILDGFPRTISQALMFDSAVQYYKLKNIKIINIEVSHDEVRRRMIARGRTDDKNNEVIEKRIKWYKDNVVPVINHFRKKDEYEVLDINGEQDVNGVFEEIKNKLHY
jgi:adenylate kinase